MVQHSQQEMIQRIEGLERILRQVQTDLKETGVVSMTVQITISAALQSADIKGE
jgi:hypothetical protein